MLDLGADTGNDVLTFIAPLPNGVALSKAPALTLGASRCAG